MKNLKPVKLQILGLGKIKSPIEIDLTKPVTAITGERTHGKSTILKAVKLLGQSRGYWSGLINNESKKAVVRLEFGNGSYIRKEFANDLNSGKYKVKFEAVINGKVEKQNFVSTLFNPFQLDQEHFRRMNETDRMLFLLEVFKVDT